MFSILVSFYILHGEGILILSVRLLHQYELIHVEIEEPAMLIVLFLL